MPVPSSGTLTIGGSGAADAALGASEMAKPRANTVIPTWNSFVVFMAVSSYVRLRSALCGFFVVPVSRWSELSSVAALTDVA
jgi:hypothetical protein